MNIVTEVEADGRTRYVVAGMIVTYVEQEAIDLTATGVFSLQCPLTRGVTVPLQERPKLFTDAPPFTGSLPKFPWGK